MSWTDDLSMPFDRPSLLEIPPVYRQLHQAGSIVRVTTPTNDPAWLVTKYEDVRALFGDERLDRYHPDPDSAPRAWAAAPLGKPLSTRVAREMRQMRTRNVHAYFSASRVRRLGPRVQAIADQLIGDMVAAGPPADLHAGFTIPLPVLTICVILGVPPEDRADFCAWSDEAELMADQVKSREAMVKLGVYIYGLMERKLAEPADDVLTQLATGCRAGEYGQEAAVMWALGLLFAGHRSTSARIEFGVLYLLENPDARAALRDGPAAVSKVVEEVLRIAGPGYLSVVPRWANERIDAGGVTIQPGELVLLGYHAANADPAAFADPGRFDHSRDPNPHVAFGYGAHFCPGASLSRLEMQVAFQTIFSDLPGLRVTVPAGELGLREDEMTGGLSELPVTW